MSKLLIVESPSKIKGIKKYLGADYEVMASKGHVRDLPKSRLGVDVDKDFAPQYINMIDKIHLSYHNFKFFFEKIIFRRLFCWSIRRCTPLS
jgi:DNA topoisomerase IA